MMIRNLVVAGVLASGIGHANAELFDRGDGLIFDDAINVTWLANANLIRQAEWSIAVQKIADLNSQNYLGFNDWRLPTTTLFDSSCTQAEGANGYGCSGSEMGHLFYEVLGGGAGRSILDSHNEKFSLFRNIQAGYYWSATPSPLYPGPYAFAFGSGVQDASNYPGSNYYSWLVRSGDVTAGAPIPEPETYAMMLAGLGFLGIAARRKGRGTDPDK